MPNRSKCIFRESWQTPLIQGAKVFNTEFLLNEFRNKIEVALEHKLSQPSDLVDVAVDSLWEVVCDLLK